MFEGCLLIAGFPNVDILLEKLKLTGISWNEAGTVLGSDDAEITVSIFRVISIIWATCASELVPTSQKQPK